MDHGRGAPVLAAVAWALFVSRQASQRTDDSVRLVVEVAIFGAGVAALAVVGSPRLAAAFGSSWQSILD